MDTLVFCSAKLCPILSLQRLVREDNFWHSHLHFSFYISLFPSFAFKYLADPMLPWLSRVLWHSWKENLLVRMQDRSYLSSYFVRIWAFRGDCGRSSEGRGERDISVGHLMEGEPPSGKEWFLRTGDGKMFGFLEWQPCSVLLLFSTPNVGGRSGWQRSGCRVSQSLICFTRDESSRPVEVERQWYNEFPW